MNDFKFNSRMQKLRLIAATKEQLKERSARKDMERAFYFYQELAREAPDQLRQALQLQKEAANACLLHRLSVVFDMNDAGTAVFLKCGGILMDDAILIDHFGAEADGIWRVKLSYSYKNIEAFELACKKQGLTGPEHFKQLSDWLSIIRTAWSDAYKGFCDSLDEVLDEAPSIHTLEELKDAMDQEEQTA